MTENDVKFIRQLVAKGFTNEIKALLLTETELKLVEVIGKSDKKKGVTWDYVGRVMGIERVEQHVRNVYKKGYLNRRVEAVLSFKFWLK